MDDDGKDDFNDGQQKKDVIEGMATTPSLGLYYPAEAENGIN